MMFAQLTPLRLHRRHWYVNVIGAVPVHWPGSAVSVEPTCVVPEIVGGDVFVGLTWAAAVPGSGRLSAPARNAASAARAAAAPTRTPVPLRCFIATSPVRYRPPDGGAPQGDVHRAVARTVSWTSLLAVITSRGIFQSAADESLQPAAGQPVRPTRERPAWRSSRKRAPLSRLSRFHTQHT